MFIRYRESRNPNKKAKVHVTTINQTRYEFWEKDEWVCDVTVRKHVEWLLSGKGAGNYEVAYEKYGVHFQPTGQEIKQNGHPVGVLQDAITQVAAGVSVELVNQKLSDEANPPTAVSGGTHFTSGQKMTLSERVKKMQEARNRNRLAKGLPPIEFKS